MVSSFDSFRRIRPDRFGSSIGHPKSECAVVTMAPLNGERCYLSDSTLKKIQTFLGSTDYMLVFKTLGSDYA
jgi:hypothetical protein